MTKTMSQKIIGMNGDEAVAFAAKQAQVDVVAAYPITPQTIIVERFSDYVANGEVDTQFVCVEFLDGSFALEYDPCCRQDVE